MSGDDEPERLLRAASDPELQSALRGLVERLPDSERVSAIAHKLAAATGVEAARLIPQSTYDRAAEQISNTVPQGSGTVPTKLGTALGTGGKVVSGAVLVFAAAGIGWWLQHSEGAEPRVQRILQSAPAARARSTAEALVPPPRTPNPAPGRDPTTVLREAATAPSHAVASNSGAPTPADEANGLAAPSVAPPRRSKRPRSVPSEDTKYDALDTSSSAKPPAVKPTSPDEIKPTSPDEIGILRLAQDALQGNPSRALELTAQHRTEFPRSALGQERELIEISALARLGRMAEARARAARFRERHPHSAYERQLGAILPAR
jgi:hypothetical protein